MDVQFVDGHLGLTVCSVVYSSLQDRIVGSQELHRFSIVRYTRACQVDVNTQLYLKVTRGWSGEMAQPLKALEDSHTQSGPKLLYGDCESGDSS